MLAFWAYLKCSTNQHNSRYTDLSNYAYPWSISTFLADEEAMVAFQRTLRLVSMREMDVVEVYEVKLARQRTNRLASRCQQMGGITSEPGG